MSGGVELKKMSKLGEQDNLSYEHAPDDANNVISPDKVNIVIKDNDDGLRHRPSHTVSTFPPDSPTATTSTSPPPSSSKELSRCARGINYVQEILVNFTVTHQKLIRHIFIIILVLLYFAYFAYALRYRFGDEGSIRLVGGTVVAVVLVVIHFTWDPVLSRVRGLTSGISPARAHVLRRRIRWLLYVVSLVTMVTLLIVLVALETPDNLISLGGLAAFVFLAWVTSINPAKVNWHPVFWGFSLQFFFACIILRTKEGYYAFKWLGDRVSGFISYADEGAAFVFGENFRVHFFAFAIMPMVVFFSSVMSMLYYLGVMQKVISVLGRFLGFCMGTTAAESLCAAFNIFLGMTDTPMMVRPYLPKMTKSELHAIMTGGFATIAGSVLGAYIGFGVPANHLLSASVMSAPAALAISKLTYPETEPQAVQEQEYNMLTKGTESNLIEAASAGASYSILLVGSILSNIIAFLSILKFVNATLTWFGERAGVPNLTFELICSYLLYPVAVFMGTELGPDCRRMGELVGIKTFTNEFIAYTSLQKLLINRKLWNNYTTYYDVSDPSNVAYDDLDITLTQWGMRLEKGFLSPRSEVIATYALCGFSNFGSMGILLGAMSAMAPERRADMASIIFRAMIAGNVACFFTACIAGLFYQEFD